MSRINIEDCWWTDPRRDILIKLTGGDSDIADGAITKAWLLSQRYWKENKSLIPLFMFQTLHRYQEILDSKLAFIEGDFVYVCGTKQHHNWILKKLEGAQKGGQKSSKNRLESYGTSQPNTILNNLQKLEVDRSFTEVDSSCPNPLPLPLPLPLENKKYMSSSDDVSVHSIISNKSTNGKDDSLNSHLNFDQSQSLARDDFNPPQNNCALTPPLCPLIEIWNGHCGYLRKVRTLGNGPRKKMALARWKENPRKEYWIEVITKITQSPFCQGNNKTNWHANFDFLIKPDTHLKVLEGFYDNQNIKNESIEMKDKWEKALR